MESQERTTQKGKAGWPALALALCLVTGISLAYLARERRTTRDLGTARAAATVELTRARDQIERLDERLDALSAAPAAPVHQKRLSPLSLRPPVVPKKATPQAAEDKRLSQVQVQFASQQRDLAGARDEVRETRDEFQNSLASTRHELNESIARTHDEVVALQRRSELNVYEFQLTKSKKGERVGPIQIILRKTNQKHKFYDLSMIVDDIRLDKKHVNLFEPVWITLADRPRPLELVVNQVGKDTVAGYLSEPKYKTGELAVNSPASERSPRLEARTEE